MPYRFAKMKSSGDKIAALTAYDSTFAALLAAAGVDILLVGDSLGMVLQGRRDTLRVTMDEMVYHTACVAAGRDSLANSTAENPAAAAFIIGDMPFASFQQSPSRAFANAARLLAAGAQMVKLEGGEEMAETIAFLTARGVPVCAHVGLMPQSVRAVGGYKVQGRGAAAATVVRDAKAAAAAGASLIVLELIPQLLAAEVSDALSIPTIGIGSGGRCDGQVLVLHDAIGLSPGKKFTRNFLQGGDSIRDAIVRYVDAVKSGAFPGAAQAFD